MKRTNWRPADDRPSWVRRVLWLWDQDDACWREDSPERAWIRQFGEPLPPLRIKNERDEYVDNPRWIAMHDVGDAIFFLDVHGFVYVASYPGNCSIGIVRGPGVAL